MWCQVLLLAFVASSTREKQWGWTQREVWGGDVEFCQGRTGTSMQGVMIQLVGIRSHMGQGEKPSVGHPGLGLDIVPHQASPFPHHISAQGCVWC